MKKVLKRFEGLCEWKKCYSGQEFWYGRGEADEDGPIGRLRDVDLIGLG